MSVRVHGLAPDLAHRAIAAAFAEIAQVHALMSFHDQASDVSRLNREAHKREVCVDARTWHVLARAAEFAAVSAGVFDVAIAPRLVAASYLPRPRDADDPDPLANAGDIELLPGRRVRFARPLWIDVSGIAKGYAVDRAIDAAMAFEPAQVSVNAGGDLRVAGSCTEQIELDTGDVDQTAIGVMELRNAALASSGSKPAHDVVGVASRSPHLDATGQNIIPLRRFVAVVAPSCIDADACTKIVLAKGAAAQSILTSLHARAAIYEPARGWLEVA